MYEICHQQLNCFLLNLKNVWKLSLASVNALKIVFFGSIIEVPCISYEFGQRSTKKYEKSNLGVLRQKSNKVAMVHRIQESSLEFQRVSYEIARSSWSSMSAF